MFCTQPVRLHQLRTEEPLQHPCDVAADCVQLVPALKHEERGTLGARHPCAEASEVVPLQKKPAEWVALGGIHPWRDDQRVRREAAHGGERLAQRRLVGGPCPAAGGG